MTLYQVNLLLSGCCPCQLSGCAQIASIVEPLNGTIYGYGVGTGPEMVLYKTKTCHREYEDGDVDAEPPAEPGAYSSYKYINDQVTEMYKVGEPPGYEYLISGSDDITERYIEVNEMPGAEPEDPPVVVTTLDVTYHRTVSFSSEGCTWAWTLTYAVGGDGDSSGDQTDDPLYGPIDCGISGSACSTITVVTPTFTEPATFEYEESGDGWTAEGSWEYSNPLTRDMVVEQIDALPDSWEAAHDAWELADDAWDLCKETEVDDECGDRPVEPPLEADESIFWETDLRYVNSVYVKLYSDYEQQYPYGYFGAKIKYKIGVPYAYFLFPYYHASWVTAHAAWVIAHAAWAESHEGFEPEEPVEPVEPTFFHAQWDVVAYPPRDEPWRRAFDIEWSEWASIKYAHDAWQACMDGESEDCGEEPPEPGVEPEIPGPLSWLRWREKWLAWKGQQAARAQYEADLAKYEIDYPQWLLQEAWEDWEQAKGTHDLWAACVAADPPGGCGIEPPLPGPEPEKPKWYPNFIIEPEDPGEDLLEDPGPQPELRPFFVEEELTWVFDGVSKYSDEFFLDVPDELGWEHKIANLQGICWESETLGSISNIFSEVYNPDDYPE